MSGTNMPSLFKFKKQTDKNSIPQIRVQSQKSDIGLEFSIFSEENKQSYKLPLKLSITEMKQQKFLPLLEALEELWYEEILEEKGNSYILIYDNIYDLPEDIKILLGVPKEEILQFRLVHEGAIGTSRFNLLLEKNFGSWKNLHKTSQQFGPLIKLADQSEILLPKQQYDFEKMLHISPDPKDREKIFGYVANIIHEAKKLNIPIDDYLEKQQYLFIDQLELDVIKECNELKVVPKYASERDISDDILSEMSENAALYYSDSRGQKVFVNQQVYGSAKKIRNTPSIKDGNIPRFIENPESFLPDIENIDLSLFSERVKSLGIRVYKAQPFLHASEKERGWFELNAGFSAVDNEGEVKEVLQNETIQSLILDAKEKGEPYISWNGSWLKIPDDAEDFINNISQDNGAVNNGEMVDISKLPFILEIFENINRLEFNQPLLDLQERIEEWGITTKTPPNLFMAKLKPFQVEGFLWMKLLHFRKLGGLLADDMGLGKTVQVISLLAYLYEMNELTPTLIVAPKTLIDNWFKEIQKFAPTLVKSLYIHRGPQRSKNPDFIEKYGITLTTYQTLIKDQLVFAQIDWQSIICDEAQAIKNPSTSASKVIKALKSKFRLAMTGTPVENGLSEFWSIMDYVQPGILGSLNQFKQEFVHPIEKQSEEDAVNKLISKISFIYKRRTKNEELKGQLPDKHIITKPVKMGTIQQELYREVLSLVQNKMMDGLQAIQKLKALSAHPALINNDFLNLSIKDIPKLEMTLDIIENIRLSNEKVLIFTEFKKMQKILREEIRKKFNINPQIINGMTSRRMEIVDEFNNNPGFDVLILSPKAAGTGLTITSANHVIHYTRWWNPAVENQATDRVYRIGQEKQVYVYYPIITDQTGFTSNGTVEEIVHKILQEKQELASNVITTSKKINIEEEVFKHFNVK
ncbi:DEAD/DEAH box helicase [Heyndrickxia sporothermodurans]|uniref:DEAD/DEAH box helicase n=1 Tax=Heyndrickxia sporothermodurans TaxID=46224 RepID=UPI002DBC9FA1|nr:DEAD/DEAH box helicase [Heyndrickxia sporothermodurans]MEB6550733.1 DEAD/DEAH box helicase [Heyndrickxia sporothermodurans]